MTQPTHQPYTPKDDEKLTQLMIYTTQKLIWGQLISKKVIRVSSWLTTDMAPKYMTLADAQALIFGAGQHQATLKFPFLNIETSQINAYHLLAPSDESPYFDVNEPNRKMEPVTAMTGVFHFEALIRMATQSNLNTFLGVSKGEFLPIYDAKMTSPVLTAIKGVNAPFVLIRQPMAIFSYRG